MAKVLSFSLTTAAKPALGCSPVRSIPARRVPASREHRDPPVDTNSRKTLRRVARLCYGMRGTGNMLVQGENSEVLGCLARAFHGSVRCIYIDPPYNNQERYRHFDDALSHDKWLAMLTDRLARLQPFLRPDGSIWISIDDREVHYLKVAADQVFGRENFVSTIVWQQRTTRENRKVFSNNHEYLLVYASDLRLFRSTRHQLPLSPDVAARYRNPDDDPRGPWQSVSLNVQAGHGTKSQFYELVAPNGRRYHPPEGRCWVFSAARMQDQIRSGNVWFGSGGKGVPRLKRFLSSRAVGLTPETLWLADQVSTTDSAKKHQLTMFPNRPVFDTPKPEELIQRVLYVATDPGDLVLDAFLGSGTTAAVAHKMGRRYVGIERGAHAVSHCAARLRMVVDGEAGGASAAVGWVGGGGFDFFRLA